MGEIAVERSSKRPIKSDKSYRYKVSTLATKNKGVARMGHPLFLAARKKTTGLLIGFRHVWLGESHIDESCVFVAWLCACRIGYCLFGRRIAVDWGGAGEAS
jgi:hypothetical protein